LIHAEIGDIRRVDYSTSSGHGTMVDFTVFIDAAE
jgi:hypothetical protein